MKRYNPEIMIYENPLTIMVENPDGEYIRFAEAPRRVVVTEQQARELNDCYTQRRRALERVESADIDARCAEGRIGRIMAAINGAEVKE
jgi:hypothetical protein